jgi:hypothetical protein
MKARDMRVYTLDDALALRDQTGHTGPWDDALLAAAEQSGNPHDTSGFGRLAITLELDTDHGIPDFRLKIEPA